METVTIEKLVFGGQGLAHAQGKSIFVWNALPGEEVEIEYIKNKKDYAEAIATKIINPSTERVNSQDDHFLSSSPWQIMTYQAENEWKKNIATETYHKIGGEVFKNAQPEILYPEVYYGYRNKMEFSFIELPDGTISLAFFKRGSRTKIPVQKSELAEPIIHDTAVHILKWINEQKIPLRSLKALIIRSNGESLRQNSSSRAIAALFIKDQLEFENFPQLTTQFIGFQLYYSTHKSPASVPTKLLYTEGQDYLTATILDTQLTFGLLSFFQIHLPIFTTALEDISTHIPANSLLLDMYSGVGSIGIPLSRTQKNVILIDNNEEAISYAKHNIDLNNRQHTSALCAPAEKMTDYITDDKIIILDPPRAGLHSKVTHRLLETTPPLIIYLSCDIATHARDVNLLSEKYDIVFHRLYNFFPRTPHIEGLVILKLKY